MSPPNADNDPESRNFRWFRFLRSRGPVQVVNVYPGKVSEEEHGGIPDWLKEKLEELMKSLTGTGERSGHGHKTSSQPLVTNSLLILIFLVVIAQTALQILRPPPEEHKDDNGDRQVLMSMLTMMAARSQAPVVAPPAPQTDASPKIVVVPVSIPSAPASPATTGSTKFQFEPLQIEVKTTSTSTDTGIPNPPQIGASRPTESHSIQLAPGNPIKITAWFDVNNKCRKKQDDDRTLLYFAISNVGASAIWIDSVFGPKFEKSLVPTWGYDLLSQQNSTSDNRKPTEFIYPGETRIKSASCADTKIGDETISREAPGFAVLEIRYHLDKIDNPLLIAQAAFFLDPPTLPTLVGDFNRIPADNSQSPNR
jgi:hypothetical protein